MSWERTKALTPELPPAPSLLGWFLVGVLMVIAGVLLFILHASGTVKFLSQMNIWWVSLIPPGGWLLVFCLRYSLWDKEVKQYQFYQNEAQYGQQQWEAWAQRYLAILGSSVVLPNSVTAKMMHSFSPGQFSQQYGLACRIPDISRNNEPIIKRCLGGIRDSVRQLSSDLPLNVTFLTDTPSDELISTFRVVWGELFPDRATPEDITIIDTLSMSKVEERLKQSVLSVDLLLVMQLTGDEAYSDGLAALLMTSDDVAKKYHLPYTSRLLRPMPLDMTKFADDIILFLETQTVACRTSRVLGDAKTWTEKSAELITQGGRMNAPWQAEDTAVLEKWCGIQGPFAPWLLTALAADLVILSKTSSLTLLSTETEHFITTIIPGSEDEYTGQ